MENIDTMRMAKIQRPNFLFTPYIAPSYTPELNFLVSGGGIMSFVIQPENPKVKRSSIPFSVGYSTNKSLSISAISTLYGFEDRWRASLDFGLKDMPDHYWGVGYAKAVSVPMSASTTLYHRNWIQFTGKIVWQLFPDFFTGVNYDFNQTIATELNPVMKLDTMVVKYGTHIRNAGFGLVLEYDDRDFPANAYSGTYISQSGTFYSKEIGGDHDFFIYQMDIRKYFPIEGLRQTLAMQLFTKTCIGDVPWTEMAKIGNATDMRGYYLGRFRDKTVLYVLMEYRKMFKRKTPNKFGSYQSRHGFVLWTGSAIVGSSYTNLSYWLPNLGVGYRFELQPRLNARIDYGFGTDSQGLYVTFSEAF